MASHIPNGKQQFIDINGKPLVGGTVGMYVPNTLIPKNTWQNAAQTILNTNPIILDSRGQALIYGVGVYRQILSDEDGNLIWDELVYSSGGGGGGGGPVHVITAADSPYTMRTDDSFLLCDVSGGPVTINLVPADEYGAALTIKVDGYASNFVTVIPDGADTIDGAASYVLQSTNQSITMTTNINDAWLVF